MKKLYLMCGPPGSGKSTWCKMHCHEDGLWCSRDNVRNSFPTNKDEDYSTREKKVFSAWVEYIQDGLNSNKYNEIYVDSTHLTKEIREKILTCLDLKDCEVIPVNFLAEVNLCITQNRNRKGRAFIPPILIRHMAKNFKPASLEENKLFTEIINIYPETEE